MPSNGKEFINGILPDNWMMINGAADGASFAMLNSRGAPVLTVIASQKLESDYKYWIHISVARDDRLPSWDDVKMVKEIFIGKHKKAIQILPEEDKYVNINPNCLHLFHCLDDDGLPEFSGFREDVGEGKTRTL